jgi:hypothetical protein
MVLVPIEDNLKELEYSLGKGVPSFVSVPRGRKSARDAIHQGEMYVVQNEENIHGRSISVVKFDTTPTANPDEDCGFIEESEREREMDSSSETDDEEDEREEEPIWGSLWSSIKSNPFTAVFLSLIFGIVVMSRFDVGAETVLGPKACFYPNNDLRSMMSVEDCVAYIRSVAKQ